jgi:uncharacterized membrane protein
MMTLTRNSNRAFGLILVLISIFWIWIRPWNSPWQPFIAGDGLGYYSHLPAVFIYNDSELEYKWFNDVHNKNYAYSAFANPEDNLLVQYGDRKINKYYPGLSFAWMPFFFVAHAYASVTDYAADGYSPPYQWAIGFASLFWLIAGLIYLRKLILALTGNENVAIAIPLLFFFGTNLYHFGIFNNTLSHMYSFTVNTMFLYFAHCYFRNAENRTLYFVLAGSALLLTISIRPLNGLILPAAFAFVPAGFLRTEKLFYGFDKRVGMPIIFSALLLFWHFYIVYTQTGTLFAYTYTNETFDFAQSRFTDTLFSYHNGLFVYIPLALICCVGIFFMRHAKQFVIPALFFAIVFLYASWWYWPITRRALIDFYPLLAIMMAILLRKLNKPALKWSVAALLLLSVFHFQLKNYQVNKGILSEYSTYGELFWRNYFRTDPANIYPIPPSTILAKEERTEGFDGYAGPCKWSDSVAFSKKRSLMLDQQWSSCIVSRCRYPQLFERNGWKKVRVSFQAFLEDSVNIVNMYLEFRRKDSVIVNVPFYLVKDFINPGKWDYKEFGYEITDTTLINSNTVDEVTFAIWNPAAKGRLFADDVKMEFLLTDRSFETIR